jgi:hypothetical protein
MKVIYIGGYGRSGSTVLDIILGNHSQVTGLGEVTYLADDYTGTSRTCSCGSPYDQCSFWKDFFPNSSPDVESARILRKVQGLFFIPRLLLGLVAKRDSDAYRTYHSHLFGHVEAQTQKPIIVDSSKSARKVAGRFLALHRLAGEDVYVVHLVRNGLATMESLTLTGSNWALEGRIRPPKWPGLRAAFGWALTNLWTSLLGRFLPPDHYMRLRYEDLAADPAGSLRKIGRFCGFDPEELIVRIDRNDYFQVGHLVGGNRIRLQSAIKLRPANPRPQGGRLRVSHRLMFSFTGAWLNRQYGYRGNQANVDKGANAHL